MNKKVSFNIPVHSDFRYLGDCLFSIASQKYPEFEIIIVFDVDNRRMTKKAAEEAEKALNEFNKIFETVKTKIERTLNFHIIITEPCTIGKARQIGVEAADGDIIAFIDSDCVLPSDDWLSKMVEPFEKGGEIIIGHGFSEKNPKKQSIWAPPQEIDVVFTLGAFHRDDPAIMRYSILCNPYNPDITPGTGHTLIRKSAITRAGGFRDINSCEDLDLMRRLQGRIVYIAECGVYHYYAITFGEFIRKFRKAEKNRLKAGAQGNPHKRTALVKYKGEMFTRALIGREDPAWLLWPFADTALIVAKIRTKLFA